MSQQETQTIAEVKQLATWALEMGDLTSLYDAMERIKRLCNNK